MLKIRFLGEITVEYQGEDITSKFGGKALALLCLLVLNQGKNLSREKITACLWPDSNEDAAKYNLRYNLWTIKKYIGYDENGVEFLHIDRERCGIMEEYEYECDILKILSLKKVTDTDLDTLEEVYDLFGGDFMEGCYFNKCNDFNEIIIFERSRFEDLKILVLKKLVECYEKNDSERKYERTLKELLEIDPYDEETAYKLLDLYERQGKRGTAILFYNEFKNKLNVYLGIQPSAFLKQKYLELKTTDAAVAVGNVSSQRKEKVSSEKKEICIDTKCMKSVELFWISDVLRKLNSLNANIFNLYLNRRQLQELKKIQPNINIESDSQHIKIAEDSIPKVSVVNSFIDLILKLSEDFTLNIEIKNPEAMDSISKEVYEYLLDEEITFR